MILINLTLGRKNKARARGGMDPPWAFVVLQYFKKILPLIDNQRDAIQDEVKIVDCGAARGMTSFKMVVKMASIEIIHKPRKFKIVLRDI